MKKTRSQSLRTVAASSTEINEAKRMVAYFRVYELKALLENFNYNRSATKTILHRQAVELIESGNKIIIEKARNIYKTHIQTIRRDDTRDRSRSPPQSLTITPILNGQGSNSLHRHNNPQENIAVVQPIMHHQQHLPVDPNRGAIHTNGVVVSPYQYISGFPVQPDVRLKRLAFFDVLATLLKPSTLVPINQTNRVQEGTFYFHLTPQQATDIASNRDIRNGSKIEHVIQVQLRFCLLETTCEQEDYFPPNVVVKVNNKLCTLPNPIPTNKPGVEPKRPPRPVNITQNVKLSPTVPNHISVSWCTELNRAFVISVYLVRKLTSAQLLNRLKTKGVKAADYTRALIKEKLNEDADSEIATTMLKVSLICPLGKMRMSTPSRSSTCSHLQCFDASLYLQMNERKPTWNCPVCDKPGLYENLVVDGYFQEVLASSMLTSDDSEIQLHKDGSWSTHIMRNETQVLDTPSKSESKVEVILDDLEMITTDMPKSSIKSLMASNNNEPSSTTNETVEVDLTLSDSDDDDLPLKRKIPPKSAQNNSSTNNNNLVSTAVAMAAQKPKTPTNDNLSSSIISLDSPSPPSTPNPHHSNGVNSSNVVTSSCLPASSVPSSDMDTNYQINPLAINRNEPVGNFFAELADTEGCQRIISRMQHNWNSGFVTHPHQQ